MAGARWPTARDANIADVRDLLEPARLRRRQGVARSPVERRRASACRPRSSRTRSERSSSALADAAGLEPADVQFVRNEDGGGTFTFTTPDDVTTDAGDRSRQALADDRS